jgi:hypothetical protein
MEREKESDIVVSNLDIKIKKLYTRTIPLLIELIGKTRDYHHDFYDDELDDESNKLIQTLSLTIDPIIMIYSVAYEMTRLRGNFTLSMFLNKDPNTVNYGNDPVSYINEFKEYSHNNMRSKIGYKNDQADCYRIAYIIDKIKNITEYIWCNTFVLMKIICEFVINNEIHESTSLLNISDRDFNLILNDVDMYYERNSYERVALYIIDEDPEFEQTVLESEGTNKDFKHYRNLTKYDKIEIWSIALKRCYEFGHDYTMYYRSEDIITKTFFELLYRGG